jgi:hypothetical protein
MANRNVPTTSDNRSHVIHPISSHFAKRTLMANCLMFHDNEESSRMKALLLGECIRSTRK